MKLVAFCGNYDVKGLQEYYEESCSSGWFDTMQQPVLDVDLLDEAADEELDGEEEEARNPILDWDCICFVFAVFPKKRRLFDVVWIHDASCTRGPMGIMSTSCHPSTFASRSFDFFAFGAGC